MAAGLKQICCPGRNHSELLQVITGERRIISRGGKKLNKKHTFDVDLNIV